MFKLFLQLLYLTCTTSTGYPGNRENQVYIARINVISIHLISEKAYFGYTHIANAGFENVSA